MNRYEFEDLISDYIENSLSLSKRKEFENYLTEDPEAESLVDLVRSTIDQLRNIQKVKVSDRFNERLMSRIKNEKLLYRLKPVSGQKTFMGFTPVYASLMTGLTIALLFVSMQLFSPDMDASTSQNQFYANDPVPTLSNPATTRVNPKPQDLAEAEEDSLDENSANLPKKDYTKRIQLVND